ncbi:hypothetical protein GLOTRDRAFT_117975 [Gloeophyllum trabeum ATCC 11539]|uniref:ERCC4 domain-containing protein n=1 Tax=Gloeophyllum trabeum (strain ATCC 11539 / FP-39264 / Madison 617) TaxID=670483 RepID=S7PVL2_GLOTA|nr:uncharacterized protein GLOTRDRAFT_117975 [Gloeophyllum trabeum ATCC 11539]EPQ51671.1 hypothetical protein GLOTRDRAFT_117975 [Gloeophyllum trabeum ATCC 11539]
MLPLLPFHKSILERIHDPATSDFVLLARGLGLRRIVCTLMKIYDSPQTLTLLLNASPEEESAIGEELGVMGCRKPGLRIVGYEMGRKDRQDLYKQGGLISVTSRILVVDMLQSDIPTELITGIIVMHAEKVTPLSLEAFIVRLYREKNKNGFLKAFSDEPEHITSGLSPLRNILKELQLRTVHIYPRFHEEIKQSLERRRADVIEIYPHLTESMKDIHGAIVQCMSTTLAELKRSNTTLDLDDINVENAYFRSFDAIVRKQLDPVWHKVGPKTKQLVSDLATLRRLLMYLLTYDALAFHAYLETIVTSNITGAGGGQRQHQSPWLLTDAANVIFQVAKRRCYTLSRKAPLAPATELDLADDEDAWAALDEVEFGNEGGHSGTTDGSKKKWLPKGMDPVLEELPKWETLAEVLQEIEEEMMRFEGIGLRAVTPGSNTVLIMTSSTRTSNLITEYLESMDTDAPSGQKGRRMMERKLRLYLWWKSKLSDRKQDGKPGFGLPDRVGDRLTDDAADGEVSEALKKKDRERRERQQSRRRVRGGAANAAPSQRRAEKRGADGVVGEKFDSVYGLLAPQQTIVVRAYSDDTDDMMLAEIQPRFIVMFEPNQDFVRRIEVYRSSSPGLGVRVYFMVYRDSSEEHKYLLGLRREKEAFERLIKERGSMLMPILEERRSGSNDAVIKTISSRIAGGRKELNKEPSRVIVDLREFRSSLPSLLHASGLQVIPATLTVGDYILTPDMCVERKSIPDLVSSFNSGRLYTQCELMSVHYKQPILLIEFEEHKSFSLETVSDMKSYVKPTGKYPPKKTANGPNDPDGRSSGPTIQSKLVLLTLSFPRLRIIWSSSPYATTDIFADLKTNNPEPDPSVAVSVGAEDDSEKGAGVNATAEELLRCLPGVTAKNVHFVMGKVGSVRELCELPLERVQEILGVEPGKACYEFMHKGERRR